MLSENTKFSSIKVFFLKTILKNKYCLKILVYSQNLTWNLFSIKGPFVIFVITTSTILLLLSYIVRILFLTNTVNLMYSWLLIIFGLNSLFRILLNFGLFLILFQKSIDFFPLKDFLPPLGRLGGSGSNLRHATHLGHFPTQNPTQNTNPNQNSDNSNFNNNARNADYCRDQNFQKNQIYWSKSTALATWCAAGIGGLALAKSCFGDLSSNIENERLKAENERLKDENNFQKKKVVDARSMEDYYRNKSIDANWNLAKSKEELAEMQKENESLKSYKQK